MYSNILFNHIKSYNNIDIYEVNDKYDQFIKNNNIIFNVVQNSIRNNINKIYGIKRNPWCIIKNASYSLLMYNLSYDSIWYWKIYSAQPKIIATYQNKLVAIYCKNIIYQFFIINNIYKDYYISKFNDLCWTSINNTEHDGIPFYKELDNDPLHRKALFEFYEHTNTYKQISNSFLKNNHKTYEWDINGKLLNKK